MRNGGGGGGRGGGRGGQEYDGRAKDSGWGARR